VTPRQDACVTKLSTVGRFVISGREPTKFSLSEKNVGHVPRTRPPAHGIPPRALAPSFPQCKATHAQPAHRHTALRATHSVCHEARTRLR
jgi:hypothetical protein